MFLAAQTAVLAATFTPTTLTAAALGLLGGICLNVSIDGALSILPAFAYFVSLAEPSGGPAAGLHSWVGGNYRGGGPVQPGKRLASSILSSFSGNEPSPLAAMGF